MNENAYKLHFKTNFQGIPVSVENRKGSYRRGMDRDGNEWAQKMEFHYGRIPRTRGADGDMVDVFLGPDRSAPMVYVIEQVWPDTGKFDEHKAMLGFRNKQEAIRGYKRQYNRPGFYGGCLTMTMEEFKGWLKEQSLAKVERRNLENRVVSGQRVLDAQQKYKIPAGVSSAARQAIEAREKHGDKVKGGTRVGWTRARQLASGGEVSRDVVMRMRSFFARHEGNQKYEGDFPWGDAGYTAWKIWGGDAGKRWVESLKMEDSMIVQDEYLGWDKLVAKLMKENGYSKERAEKIAYSIGKKKYGKAGMAKKAVAGRKDSAITETLQSQGTHTGNDYSGYDPEELALGVLVEKEHADDVMDRIEIAADHLEENPAYYTENKFFMEELQNEYGEGLPAATNGARKIVGKIQVQDANANTVLLEAAVTPIIKKLMLHLGFKRLIWKGNGWVIPIGLDEYGKYLQMVPHLKVHDRLLQKFGYEISLSPGWFKIVPVKNGMRDADNSAKFIVGKKYNAMKRSGPTVSARPSVVNKSGNKITFKVGPKEFISEIKRNAGGEYAKMGQLTVYARSEASASRSRDAKTDLDYSQITKKGKKFGFKRVYIMPNGKRIASLEFSAKPEKPYTLMKVFKVNEAGAVIG